MTNFNGFGLDAALQQSLERMQYTTPTPIQAQAIPLALQGHDIMGTAQTGTGKTAAFAIPLVQRLLTNPKGSALVLTPTRELGKQIMDVMHQLLGRNSPIKTAFIIGGEPMGKQFAQLRARPRLIVGTPGRINDHLERGSLFLNDTDFLVLDETDRMLDMGFTVQIERIFKYMPEKRQTLMFSATLPQNILHLSRQYMNAPVEVSVGQVNVVAQNIKQDVLYVEQNKKYPTLLHELGQRDGSVIIFVKTKYGADRMATNLRKDGFTADALHGDLRQNKRSQVMQGFRKQNFRILIATDIAARGLDVPHIEHVINYDLPQLAEDFIHRMGRTARAGAEGSAVSFISSQDNRKWYEIERLINPDGAKKPRPSEPKKTRKAPAKSSGRKSPEKRSARAGFSEERGGPSREGKAGRPAARSAEGRPTRTKEGFKERSRGADDAREPRSRRTGEDRPNRQNRDGAEARPAKRGFSKPEGSRPAPRTRLRDGGREEGQGFASSSAGRPKRGEARSTGFKAEGARPAVKGGRSFAPKSDRSQTAETGRYADHSERPAKTGFKPKSAGRPAKSGGFAHKDAGAKGPRSAGFEGKGPRVATGKPSRSPGSKDAKTGQRRSFSRKAF